MVPKPASMEFQSGKGRSKMGGSYEVSNLKGRKE